MILTIFRIVINILNLADLNEFLNAAGVTCTDNCINLTYDTTGFYYEIPNYCINDPYKYDYISRKDSVKQPREDTIDVIVRKTIQDKTFNIKNSIFVYEFKKIISKNFETFELNEQLIRLFYSGKELRDDDQLWMYNILNGSIVQMMIRTIVQ